MALDTEKKIFEDYLAARNLKHSRQREEVLDIFLNINRHLSAHELYQIAQKKYPKLGFATIYRTLKLFCESGLGRELKFEDGTARYEHLYGHQHHDHLICTECGKLTEVIDPAIEQLQEKLFLRHGFSPQRHRLELYGICKNCKK